MVENRLSPVRINRDALELTQAIDGLRKLSPGSPGIFGEQESEKLALLRRNPHSPRVLFGAVSARRRNSILDGIRTRLYTAPGAFLFFTGVGSMSDNEPLRMDFIEATNGDQDWRKRILDRTIITNTDLENLLAKHVRGQRELQNIGLAEKYGDSFKNKLWMLAKREGFSDVLTDDEIKKRFASLETVYLTDYLLDPECPDVPAVWPLKVPSSVGGWFDWARRRAIVGSLNALNDTPRGTAFHEWLHGLEGFSGIKKRFKAENRAAIIIQRGGFSFHGLLEGQQLHHALVNGEDPDIVIDEIFILLDEGITSELELKLLGFPNSKSTHVLGDTILNILRSDGQIPIPSNLFYKAFFEDYNPESLEKVPHWKNLQRAIAEAFEPGFLANVNRVIKKDGLQAGMDYIKVRKREQRVVYLGNPPDLSKN